MLSDSAHQGRAPGEVQGKPSEQVSTHCSAGNKVANVIVGYITEFTATASRCYIESGDGKRQSLYALMENTTAISLTDLSFFLFLVRSFTAQVSVATATSTTESAKRAHKVQDLA